jgi:hypothetical protein
MSARRWMATRSQHVLKERLNNRQVSVLFPESSAFRLSGAVSGSASTVIELQAVLQRLAAPRASGHCTPEDRRLSDRPWAAEVCEVNQRERTFELSKTRAT